MALYFFPLLSTLSLCPHNFCHWYIQRLLLNKTFDGSNKVGPIIKKGMAQFCPMGIDQSFENVATMHIAQAHWVMDENGAFLMAA